MPPNTLLRTTFTSRPSSLFLRSILAPTSRVAHPSYSTASASTSKNGGPVPPTTTQQPKTSTIKTGTVVSAGLMDRTVRVLYKHTVFDKYLQKTFPTTTTFMVSDPRNSLREGDVVEFSSGWRASKRVRHVVERIVAPFGAAIADRPAVLSREERIAERERKASEKVARRSQRDGKEPPKEGKPPGQRVGRIKRLIAERLRNPDGKNLRKNAA